METVRKTITVTKLQHDWINSQIASGQSTNFSEYIRDLVSRDQSLLMEIESIRDELIKGENSGEPRSFDKERFMAVMATKHAK